MAGYLPRSHEVSSKHQTGTRLKGLKIEVLNQSYILTRVFTDLRGYTDFQ